MPLHFRVSSCFPCIDYRVLVRASVSLSRCPLFSLHSSAGDTTPEQWLSRRVDFLQKYTDSSQSIAREAMKIYLETDRLILRQFTKDDADNLEELDSDPDVVRFVDPQYPLLRETVVQQTIPRLLQYYETSESYGLWAAVKKSNDEFIGWFHLRPSPTHGGEIELGYRLKKSAWGNGYATEGSRALIQKGFTELGCDRIISTALTANRASIRVMEKAGLQFESNWIYHSRNQTDEPAVKYSLFRKDWEQMCNVRHA